MSIPRYKKGSAGGASGKRLDLKPVPHDASVARQNKDAPDAEDFIRRHGEASWRAINGEALREAELAAEKSREDAKDAQTRLRKARERRDGLNEYVNVARHRDGDEEAPAGKDVPFTDWNWYDKLVTYGCAGALVMLLALGVANVAVTILGSGIPVFLEQPYLAWMLGGVVPAAAFTVKSGYHLFDLDTSLRRYAFFIFGASVALFLTWVGLFAMSFEGVTGEVDWNALMSGESLGGGADRLATYRNIVQILGEVFIGASLFLVIDRIQATYSSSYIVKNPKWVEADKRVKELEGPAEDALRGHQTDEARLVQMRAHLEVYVGEAVSILRDMRSGKRV